MNRSTTAGIVIRLAVLSMLAGGCASTEQVDAPEPSSQPKQTQDVEPKVVEASSPRPKHEHAAFAQRVEERKKMVSTQIANRPFARPVRDDQVLQAMRTVPRHAFVPDRYQGQAYADRPLPIGFSQTISQPYIVGFMTELLELNSTSKVLEIGTGSGYQAAVAAELANAVYSIEIIEELGEDAERRLKELGYTNVHIKIADGYDGWPEHAPFDAIIVTAASSHIPPPLIKQLKPGGRLVIPLGSPWRAQQLVLLTKQEDGTIKSQGLMAVQFVPMLGKAQE